MGTDDPLSRNRIPYLDGLRGYSIITVVVLHTLGHTRVPGWLVPVDMLFGIGGLGVHIFFTLSGFLITTLLLNEWDRTGTISLRGFYERRVARIFPAAYGYILFVAILNATGILHLPWYGFATASLFCWNYGTLLNLSPHSYKGVFDHFWSLSLEEQFYLFWPGCLVLLGKINAKRLAWVMVITLPFLRLASYMLFPKSREQLGGMFHTYADVILWGSLAAFAYQEGVHIRWSKNRWFGWITLGYSILTIFIFSEVGPRVPGVGRFAVPTIYPTFAALLILWLLSGRGGIVRAILEWKILRWIGVLSYSLYVWQQIFLVEESPLRTFFPIDIGIALIAACISYYFVEAPLRQRIRNIFNQ